MWYAVFHCLVWYLISATCVHTLYWFEYRPITFTRMFEPRHNILSNVRTNFRKYAVSWLEHLRESDRPGSLVAELSTARLSLLDWRGIVRLDKEDNPNGLRALVDAASNCRLHQHAANWYRRPRPELICGDSQTDMLISHSWVILTSAAVIKVRQAMALVGKPCMLNQTNKEFRERGILFRSYLCSERVQPFRLYAPIQMLSWTKTGQKSHLYIYKVTNDWSYPVSVPPPHRPIQEAHKSLVDWVRTDLVVGVIIYTPPGRLHQYWSHSAEARFCWRSLDGKPYPVTIVRQ